MEEEDSTKLISDEDLEFISKWTAEPNFETLRAHVIKLWMICKKNYYAYRCIERFMFLKPRLPKHFAYQSLLGKLKSSEPSQNPKKVVDPG